MSIGQRGVGREVLHAVAFATDHARMTPATGWAMYSPSATKVEDPSLTPTRPGWAEPSDVTH